MKPLPKSYHRYNQCSGYFSDESSSDDQQEFRCIKNNSMISLPSIQFPQIIEPIKETFSYEDTMKLIDNIFISNYWDKKRGNAVLVNDEQILKWIKYFEHIKHFEFNSSDHHLSPKHINRISSRAILRAIPSRLWDSRSGAGSRPSPSA